MHKKQEGHRFRDLKHLKMPLFFCFVVVVLTLLAMQAAEEGYFYFFEILTAQAATELINLVGMDAVRDNAIIHLANDVWRVNAECTSITLMIMFSSFIAVYKASFKAKGIGILLGLPIIFAANIARLLLMACIDRFAPAYSVYFHDYLWQVAFIIIIVSMWMIWTEKVVKRENETAAVS